MTSFSGRMKSSNIVAVSLCATRASPAAYCIFRSQSSSHFTSARKSGMGPPDSGMGSTSRPRPSRWRSQADSNIPAANAPFTVYLP